MTQVNIKRRVPLNISFIFKIYFLFKIYRFLTENKDEPPASTSIKTSI